MAMRKSLCTDGEERTVAARLRLLSLLPPLSELQPGPLAAIPTWWTAGIGSLWATWGTGLLACGAVIAMSLAAALPVFLLLERPVSQLWPRAW